MTVFHVFLLVFVMWAVHGHGRTYETESIIYNNTQLPYKENVNPETVIDSKLGTFNFYYLALQWPNSYCIKTECRQPPQPRGFNVFTVHGLWPQYDTRQQIDCTGSTPFNEGKLRKYNNGLLVKKLTSIWPNLRRGERDIDFWEYEYENHGFCFFPTPEIYFDLTVQMSNKIPPLTLRNDYKGLNPHTPYLLMNLRRKIFEVTGRHPMLRCITHRENGIRRIYLLELRFCFDRKHNLWDCSSASNLNSCGSGEIFLP